jgi:hypothetical protein
MSEIIQNELYAEPDIAAERATQQNASDPESRTLLAPPPAESRLAMIANRSAMGSSTAVALEEERIPLFTPNQANDLQAHWDCVQAGFVDEPRQAVQDADALVSTAVIQLSEIFVDERQKLERQWDRGDVSTEDLRLALRRYRSFFAQILSA